MTRGFFEEAKEIWWNKAQLCNLSPVSCIFSLISSLSSFLVFSISFISFFLHFFLSILSIFSPASFYSSLSIFLFSFSHLHLFLPPESSILNYSSIFLFFRLELWYTCWVWGSCWRHHRLQIIFWLFFQLFELFWSSCRILVECGDDDKQCEIFIYLDEEKPIQCCESHRTSIR